VIVRQRQTSEYAELRCARTPRFLVWLLVAPAVADVAFVVIAVMVSPVWFGAVGMAAYLSLVTSGFLYRNWPTGIRVDDSGITVGAIGSPRALSRRPSAYHQSWGVYSCPWNSVRDTRVVTDRDELRRLARHYHTFNNRWGGSACDIGVMSAPFMRAALVVELYPSGVTGTALGPGRVFHNLGGMLGVPFRTWQVQPRTWDTWVVPTRRPGALAEALMRYQLAGGELTLHV
jgi:hypothetical protein